MKKEIFLLGIIPDVAKVIISAIDAMFSGKFTFVQINYLNDLKKIDKDKENIVLIYIEQLNLEQRKFIWQFKVNFPQSLVVFCSKDFSVANFSWQSQAVFFLPAPPSRRAIALMMKKIDERSKSPKLKIKLNYQGGFDLVNSEDICFCEGDGNYTNIHLNNSKSILLSKKLKVIYQKLSPFPEIIRLGKSYLINTESIVKIDNNKVYFKGKANDTVSFELSSIYLKRLKEYILMFTA